jgi:TIR domain
MSTVSGAAGHPPVPKVFICYRREESAAYAGRLYDAMAARFGEENVFMDVELAPGVDFVDRITTVVGACQVLIVVMGARWAATDDETGESRLADPEDFVRLEVETGLSRPDVTPIPVLVPGARMPKREELPVELQAITRRNALELSDARWRYDVGRLNTTLDELLADAAAAPRSPSGEGSAEDEESGPEKIEMPERDDRKTATGASGQLEANWMTRWVGGRLRWLLLGGAALVAVVLVLGLVVGGGAGTCGPACVIETSFTSTDPDDCTRLRTQPYVEQTNYRSGEKALEHCRKVAENTAFKPEAVEVREVVESGDTATAEASFQGGLYDGQTMVLALLREGSQWKLDEIKAFKGFDIQRYTEAFEDKAPQGPEEVTPEEAECIAGQLDQLGSDALREAILNGDIKPFERAYVTCGASS